MFAHRLLLFMSYALTSQALEFHVMYWELKPYIYVDDGKVVGMIPEIFRKATAYCSEQENSVLKYNWKFSTRDDYDKAFMKDAVDGVSDSSANSSKTFLWAPDISYRYEELMSSKNLSSFDFFSTESLAIVIRREEISLPKKILIGLGHSNVIISYAFMLSIPFGVLLWLLENSSNDEFNGNFLQGSGKGMWWSVVTMTTVGYGDIAPKTTLGKLVAVVWMLIGVTLTALLTATVTESITDVSGINLNKKTFSVVKNSYEEDIVKINYQPTVKRYGSYKDSLQAVRKGEAYATLMNSDVAAHMQEYMALDNPENGEPLAIVSTVPVQIPIKVFFSSQLNGNGTREFIECMLGRRRKDIFYWTEKKYRRRYLKTEQLYIGSMQEVFQNLLFLQVTCGIAASCIVFGFLCQITGWRKQKAARHKEVTTSGKSKDEMTSLMNSVKREVQQTIRKELKSK